MGGQESGQIIDSFAKGDVAGGDNSLVGGLLGFQYGSNVLRSYATGAVTGGKSSAVGGLVGQNSGSIWLAAAACICRGVFSSGQVEAKAVGVVEVYITE